VAIECRRLPRQQSVDEVEGGTVPVDGEMGVQVLVPAADAETARQVLES